MRELTIYPKLTFNMNTYINAFICLTILFVTPVSAEDYVLTINGLSKEISLDEESEVILPSGDSLLLTLHLKEYSGFSGDLFSFEHKSTYRPNRQNLGDGIFQTAVFTPLGTGMLIQEYMQLNPTSLVDLMLEEITKEEVEYGYEYVERVIQKEIGGITISGKEAVTSYLGEEWTRSVLAHGGRDQGIIIISFLKKGSYEEDRDLIEHFWESLEIDKTLR